MMDKNKLIESIKHSSKYNSPCPDWVYEVIEAFDDEKEKAKPQQLVETRFLGDWIEISGRNFCRSIKKDRIIRFERRWNGTTTFVLDGDYVSNEHSCDMPYEEFKAHMHINLNPSYDQRKEQAFDFFKR